MLLAAVLILIATGPAHADAAPRITWMVNDYPPSNILSGPLAGQGFGDRTFRYFAERLPEFQHDISPASVQTFQELARRHQDGICKWSLLKTPERENYLIFSGPIYFIISNQVIVQQARQALLAPFLNANGAVDVKALLADTRLTVSVVRGRAYLPVIDQALQANLGAAHIQISTHDLAPLKQVATGWVDYTFGYPFEVLWNACEQGQDWAFAYFPVAGEAIYRLAYFGCSRGPLSEQLIARINALITAAGPRPPWLAYYLEWLDEAARARFEQEFAAHNPWRAVAQP